MRTYMKNICRLDIQSLAVFDEVFRVASVSAAAKSLGVGASWVSKTLNKLRFIFNDELFVRSGSVLSPTNLAQELEPVIKRILEISSDLNDVYELFDNRDLSDTFTLCCDDAILSELAPDLFSLIKVKAPNIKLKFVRLSEQTDGFLRTMMVDMYIGESHDFSSDVKVLPVFMSDMVVAMSIQHTLANKVKLSISDILSQEFCGTNYQENRESPLDRFLSLCGLERNIALWIPGYIQSINVLRQNRNMLSIVPAYISNYIQNNYPDILCKPLISTVPKSQIVLAWHVRVGNSKSHAWVRKSILECLTEYSDDVVSLPCSVL